jgi:MFS family permease
VARSPLADELPAAAATGAARARLPAAAWLVIASLAATGAALGGVDVAVPAIARAAETPAAAGLLLACMGVGTVLAGLLAGLRTSRRPPLVRLALLQPALGLGLAACALLHRLDALAATLMLPGAALGILFVTAYVAIGGLAPPGSGTRSFAWLVTANNGGFALGAAIAATLVDNSPQAALWLAAAATLPGGVLAGVAAARRQPAQ